MSDETQDQWTAEQLPPVTPEQRIEKQEGALKDALVVALHTSQAALSEEVPREVTSIIRNEAITRYHRDPIFKRRVDAVHTNMLLQLKELTPAERGGILT